MEKKRKEKELFYKYEIGEVVNGLEILEKTIGYTTYGYRTPAYKVKC